MRRASGTLAAVALALAIVAFSRLPALGQQGSVAGTLHNLSASGPGAVRSLTEPEICKFCHIPHSAVVPAALWSRSLPTAGYQVPMVRAGQSGKVPAPQPDGASRLCLSCHDGTIALGDVAGQASPIRMVGAQRLAPGRPGFIGTDLSGSHPVSFVVPDGDAGLGASESDMGLKALAVIAADADVKLDAQGKMQCTTCHDPHKDLYYTPGQVPHFWVKPAVEEVCRTCHELR